MLFLNDVIAFLLEGAALVLLARWAWITPKALWLKIVFALIAVGLFVVIWGLFFSPQARYPLSGILRYVLEYLILFLPYLQFIAGNKKVIVAAAILVFLNLLVQAVFGRANW